MSATAAERQRRHRRHRSGDHTLCSPAYCPSLAGTGPLRRSDGPRRLDGPQALYRFFDRQGQLLYVGITMNLPDRFRTHRGEKPWWTDVARIEVEHHPDRAAVEQAERNAIAAERPRWNVVHNSGRPPVAARVQRSVVTVSHGGTEVRIESSEPLEEVARGVAAVAKALRGETDGQ